MKYLILIIIIATLAASMFGQATFQSRIAKQDEPKEFELNYDKFKDQTTVETHVGFRIHKARMDSLKLYIAAQVKGQETKTADVFLFHFVPLYGGGWQFLRQHHLIFLVDGESIDCGDGRQDGEVQGRGVHEWVNFIIQRDVVERLSKAQIVEIQLGTFEGSLSDKGPSRLKGILEITQ